MAHAAAAKDLVNIDPRERKRRVVFGSILSVRSQAMQHTLGLFKW